MSILIIFTDVKLFVQASLVWSNKARPFKFYSRINRGLKSCLVKVLSRSVENCRFWTLWKLSVLTFSPDVKYIVHASLVWRNWARDFYFNTHINQGLKSCLVMVSSRTVENFRFWSTLKRSEKFIFRWGNADDNIR